MTEQSNSWRDVMKVHPATDLFPMMTTDELTTLGEDIKKNGLTVPVILWKAEKDAPLFLLDGRNRLDAMEAVGLPVLDPQGKWPDHIHCERITGGDPYEYVLCFNEHRRHLPSDKRREIIAKVLKAQPSKSNRTIAKQTKTDHKTVGTERDNLEARGEIPHVSTVEDTKGRKQPRKPPSKKRRDVEDFIAEKNARMAAVKDADVPELVLQQSDLENCAAQPEGMAPPVQRILEAIEKLDDQQLAELKTALMQRWSEDLGVRGANDRPLTDVTGAAPGASS